MPELPWIFTRLDARALIDIFAVSLIFFWLLWFAQRTRAAQLIRGLIILIVSVLAASRIFNLTALNWLISRSWPMLIVAIPIIFQPELRRALEQLGHTSAWLRPPFAISPDRDAERTLDGISRAASQLSRIGYGALIVIERETGLQEYADRGVRIDALVSRQILINIFFPNSPLHDGAVIIRGDRIVAAACILPLSQREIPGGKIGTRHQAAVGITEESDAIAVVVSEETNRISIAHDGQLTENLDTERLRRALLSLLRVGTAAEEKRSPRSSLLRGLFNRFVADDSTPSQDGQSETPRRTGSKPDSSKDKTNNHD